jgi:hypothetical protein
MAGYSGTPLPQKLGIKENFRVAFVGLPADVKAQPQVALSACTVAKEGPVDFVMLFVKKQAELTREFARLTKYLAPAGMLWVSWPKKASGVATDMNENDVRRVGLEAGLVDVKVCAVSELWSGLKFVRRAADSQRGVGDRIIE